jgi:bifunctional ADP-heptose synthase (sugar kinase/adenylyltransferase)
VPAFQALTLSVAPGLRSVQPEQIVGAELVMARGGRVLSLPFVDGYSTTNIEQKILQNGGKQ